MIHSLHLDVTKLFSQAHSEIGLNEICCGSWGVGDNPK